MNSPFMDQPHDRSLIMAVENNNFELVKQLVEAGKDIHILDEYPLTWAVKVGNHEIAEYLLQKGADVKATRVKEWIYQSNSIYILQLVIQYGLPAEKVLQNVKSDLKPQLERYIKLRALSS